MATKATKPAPRARRPKAEVEREFEAIREQVAVSRETADAKQEEAARVRAAETRQAVEGVSVEEVVKSISALGLDISRALSDVSGRLTQEVERLAAVREAVELEKKELERLHNIDVASTAVDHIVQDYTRERERLEAEIAARRAEWDEEARLSERERKEQEENLRKQRQREVEDFEYKKSLERKKAQDKYDDDLRLLEKKNREKQETLEKSWQQREAALKEQEEELLRMRKEAAEFPARLKAEVERSTAEAVRAARASSEQQIVMLKKDAETEARVAELRIKGLEDTVARQFAQIEAIGKQLDEAKQQVQDIAVKAIEGASGARALSHINQIAMEQAKNRTPQG